MAYTHVSKSLFLGAALGALVTAGLERPLHAQENAVDLSAIMAQMESNGGDGEGEDKPDFPKWEDVSKGYVEVVSTSDGSSPLYGIWKREKDGQMLAELPAGYASQKHYICTTMPTGTIFAGLQWGEYYVVWKRFDKRMALIQPQTAVISTGDQASKDALKRHFVDEVLVDVPIVCMGPKGQPVVDLDALLLGNASKFFGGFGSGLKSKLAKIEKAKSFPENAEIAWEVPTSGGAIQTFHYSLSRIQGSPGYQPRAADERVGYFQTTRRDLGQFERDKVAVRYVNRWHLEKAAPELKLSPAKNPITYYLEHTVPVRYRRWVKAGAQYWNRAFEAIGISDAVVIHYQDKATGAHMEKDPEDVRYNFIRWLANDIGTAIGPSRPHPETGEILDADVILTDGWIRAFWYQANEFVPNLVSMEGYSPETLAWLDENPRWDPRVRMAPPAERSRILAERKRRRAAGELGVEHLLTEATTHGREELEQLADHLGLQGLCMASDGKAHAMAMMGLTFATLGMLDDDEDGDEDGEPEDEADSLDGIPEWFVGPMLADLVAHEVGHTLGLRHNFKASGIYSMAEINSHELKGKKAFAGSVMDYLPVNVNMDDGEVQGDYAMIDIGPYDMWAIEYGYTLDDPKKVLERVAEDGLAYGTDEDTYGPDPFARRYDFAADPHAYAASRMRLVDTHREKLLEEFVEDGESWGKARRGYQITLSEQMRAVSMLANWLGGSFIHRDRKGDPGGRTPIEPVSAEDQREALDFVIENTFFDEAFDLTPELLTHLTVQKWSDSSAAYSESSWQVHDTISGLQASALTGLLNPTALRRIYDNELTVPADQDALTLPELIDRVGAAIWKELKDPSSGPHSAREPMISSLRRNLQREHLERMIDLAMGSGYGAASKPISNLATAQLRDLHTRLGNLASNGLDPYTAAHLAECKLRIEKALDAQYIYNTDDMGGGGGLVIFFGKEVEGSTER